MLLYIKLAWRNIFRNKRRTIISGLAIAIGLASLIYVDALYIGMKNNIVDLYRNKYYDFKHETPRP